MTSFGSTIGTPFGQQQATTTNAAQWVFIQLGGPKKTLNLNGRYGPYGRPRRGTVVTETTRIAKDTIYYSGDSLPTRHEFGIRYEPLEIHGRWSDRYVGSGNAKAKAEEARAFVADRQEVLVLWGDMISANSFIESLKLEREGRTEILWTMVVEIDANNYLAVIHPTTDPRSPSDHTAEIVRALQQNFSRLPDFPVTLNGSISDMLASLVGSLNSISSALIDAGNQVDDLLSAPFNALWSIRAALGQFRTALVRLHTTYDNLQYNIALESERADDVQSFLGFQAEFSASCYQALKEASDLDRKAALAERGQIQALYQAKGGDTWESIAAQQMGSKTSCKPALADKGTAGTLSGERGQRSIRRYQRCKSGD